MTDPLVEKYGVSKNGHAIFAPSAAASWLNCSGSLLANAKAGDTAGIDAARGTVAHFVAEAWNKNGVEPTYLLGTRMVEHAGGQDHVITIDAEMLRHVGRYVDWCKEVPGDHYFEQRVDLSELMPIPGQGGTADHYACQPGKLVITDLKYGTGVRVYAEQNPQAMLYAAGAFLEWDWIYRFETIIIRICQPRLDVFEVWECSRAELLAFMAHVKVRAREAWQEGAPRSPSPKACRWCADFAKCPARIRELDEIIDQTFETEDDDEPPEARTYTADELQNSPEALAKLAGTIERLKDKEVRDLSTKALAFTLTFRSHIDRFFKGVAETLLERAEKGEPVPYFKLTDGRKKRTWRDQAEAAAWIEANWNVPATEVMPPTLLSVAKVEKLLRAKTGAKAAEVRQKLTEHVAEFSGKRTLAVDKDDRPDVDELTDDFETEEGEGED